MNKIISIAILIGALLAGPSFASTTTYLNLGWGEVVKVEAEQPRLDIQHPTDSTRIMRRFRILKTQESAPGLDLDLSGPTGKIDIQDIIATKMTPEWRPIILVQSQSGQLQNGSTTTFTVKDCRENIGNVQWFITNASEGGGAGPRYLNQQGNCSMQARFRSAGEHNVQIRYSYLYRTDEGDLRTSSALSSAPLVVEVKDRNWFSRNWKWAAPVTAGVGYAVYCRQAGQQRGCMR